MRPLRKDLPAAAKEDEQIGPAVEIDIQNGPHLFVRRGIEFLDEIDAVIDTEASRPTETLPATAGPSTRPSDAR